MKRILYFSAIALFAACNNSGKEKSDTPGDTSKQTINTTPTTPTTQTEPAPGSPTVSFAIDDNITTGPGSILVSKDKEKLSPGNDYLGMITVNKGEESFTLNILFAPKTGSYPVVGYSYTRPKQVFGGLLGGKPKITPYKVYLSEVSDLGSNNAGGHRWKIAGSLNEEITIPAMSIMKLDTTHPDNIRVKKISFSNLTFDDNWEQLMEKGKKLLDKKSG